jgi:hypothetical protein
MNYRTRRRALQQESNTVKLEKLGQPGGSRWQHLGKPGSARSYQVNFRGSPRRWSFTWLSLGPSPIDLLPDEAQNHQWCLNNALGRDKLAMLLKPPDRCHGREYIWNRHTEVQKRVPGQENRRCFSGDVSGLRESLCSMQYGSPEECIRKGKLVILL